jgi:hypothetical protein
VPNSRHAEAHDPFSFADILENASQGADQHACPRFSVDAQIAVGVSMPRACLCSLLEHVFLKAQASVRIKMHARDFRWTGLRTDDYAPSAKSQLKYCGRRAIALAAALTCYFTYIG